MWRVRLVKQNIKITLGLVYGPVKDHHEATFYLEGSTCEPASNRAGALLPNKSITDNNFHLFELWSGDRCSRVAGGWMAKLLGRLWRQRPEWSGQPLPAPATPHIPLRHRIGGGGWAHLAASIPSLALSQNYVLTMFHWSSSLPGDSGSFFRRILNRIEFLIEFKFWKHVS